MIWEDTLAEKDHRFFLSKQISRRRDASKLIFHQMWGRPDAMTNFVTIKWRKVEKEMS